MTADGYVVKDPPRGPDVGRVVSMGRRDWIAACLTAETCDVIEADTRSKATDALRRHHRGVHLR